jgi:hypothetical protein
MKRTTIQTLFGNACAFSGDVRLNLGVSIEGDLAEIHRLRPVAAQGANLAP